jgi:hypothetical protein
MLRHESSNPRDLQGGSSRRAPKLIVVTVIVFGIGTLVAMCVFQGSTVRDYVERLLLWVRGGVLIMPTPGSYRKGENVDIDAGNIEVVDLLRFIAGSTGKPIIVYAPQRQCLNEKITVSARMNDVSASAALMILTGSGFEAKEARLYGGAYVLALRQARCALEY